MSGLSDLNNLINSLTSQLKSWESTQPAAAKSEGTVSSFLQTLQDIKSSAEKIAAPAGAETTQESEATSQQDAGDTATAAAIQASIAQQTAANNTTSSAVDEYGLTADDRSTILGTWAELHGGKTTPTSLQEWVSDRVRDVEWTAHTYGADVSGLSVQQKLALAELETQSDKTSNGANRAVNQDLVNQVKALGDLSGVHTYSASSSLDLIQEISNAKAHRTS